MVAPFVIVGAGEAGIHAALALRELGYDGELLVLTDEDHLPYERPPLSKFTASGIAPTPNPIAGENALTLAKAELRRGQAIATIDRERKHLVTSSGKSVPYSKLLLATGARARRLRLQGADAESICYLRTLNDAIYLRNRIGPGARIAIIGGGLIGLEFAASAFSCGCDVTVLEAQPSVLRRGMPAAIARVLADTHAEKGVRILCGVVVDEMRAGAMGHEITLADGLKVAADIVLASTGSVLNVELADRAGLATSDGIIVDAMMRTDDPDIFGAGDCCRSPLALYGNRQIRLESWRAAQQQGRAAAAGMLNIPFDETPVPWFWSDHYDLGVQVAGLFDAATTFIDRPTGSGKRLILGLSADGTLVAAAGVGPGNTVARDIKLAQMMIASRLRPVPDDLARSDVTLKSLLASHT